jgi:predicted TPR repeat methyltransferase
VSRDLLSQIARHFAPPLMRDVRWRGMSVRDLYDSMADRYDSIVEATAYIGPNWLERNLSRVGSPSAVMDMGCANGSLGAV